MKNAYLLIRSLLFWTIGGVHFALGVPVIIVLCAFFHPRKFDRILRFFARNVIRLTGVRYQVRYAEGFDPNRTCIYVSNHVNVFDPFVVYCALPHVGRGLELESHFKVPFYGWFMKHLGTIPMADSRSPGEIKRAFRLSKDTLEDNISLIVFAEGTRTLTGRVGKFNDGVFVMARQFKYPIVPISITGSFEFKRKGDWMIRPGHIVVHVHDTIETRDMKKADIEPMRERVQAIVASPVDERYP